MLFLAMVSLGSVPLVDQRRFAVFTHGTRAHEARVVVEPVEATNSPSREVDLVQFDLRDAHERLPLHSAVVAEYCNLQNAHVFVNF
ncbi:hypothetical protein L596_016405 [Steinernema carpocapsae]|uniref:Uncharacterized protein n=1 Tax=Steinernema carpocapsae TaxID=34508 RepID=A0A4U5NIH9_STECR|nr:hypothetical protein L596_016405 [Steinernema carpocapsae]